MKSGYIRSRIPAWNAAKEAHHVQGLPKNSGTNRRGLFRFPVPPISESSLVMTNIARDVRSHVAQLNRSEHSAPLHVERFQHFGLYNAKINNHAIFFEQMIGCYPPRKFDQGCNAFFNVPIRRGGCAVDNIHRPFPLRASPLKSQDAFDDYIYPSIGSMQSHLFQRFQPFMMASVPHPSFREMKGVAPTLVRTATPFITLTTSSMGPDPAGDDFHMVVLDLSDPDEPGIFDVNFGWMALNQGPCNLALEKLLFQLWEHYTENPSAWDSNYDNESSTERLMKGERYLYTDELGNNAFMLAAQVFVQALPEAPEKPRPYPFAPFPVAKRKRSDGDEHDNIPFL